MQLYRKINSNCNQNIHAFVRNKFNGNYKRRKNTDFETLYKKHNNKCLKSKRLEWAGHACNFFIIDKNNVLNLFLCALHTQIESRKTVAWNTITKFELPEDVFVALNSLVFSSVWF